MQEVFIEALVEESIDGGALTLIPAFVSERSPWMMKRHPYPSEDRQDWKIASGVYNPRQIVFLVSPLLETVITGLGRDPQNGVSSRKLLVDGLAMLLSPTSKESALPIPLHSADASRREIAKQSFKIGKTLTQYVDDLSDPSLMNSVQVQTPCEGYIWTDAVAHLLRGPRGSGELIHIYNEWLHQIVLLRDFLLPFQNYTDVQLLIQSRTGPGLRDFEELRSRFLVQCLTRNMSQKALVDVAKVFTAPSLPSGGYGLQYSQGLILPAFLSGSNSIHLLRFHGAHLDGSLADPKAEILFDYEYEKYPFAQQSNICEPIEIVPPGRWSPSARKSMKFNIRECSLGAQKHDNQCQARYQLKLQIKVNESMHVAIDLGQIARGRRYAYQLAEIRVSQHVAPEEGWSTSARVYNPLAILSQPGLVTAQDEGLHLIPAANPVIGLALLGKLYPQNVVMLGADQPPAVAEAIGKNYGPKFVLFGGDFHHELLCPPQETKDLNIKR